MFPNKSFNSFRNATCEFPFPFPKMPGILSVTPPGERDLELICRSDAGPDGERVTWKEGTTWEA